MKLTQRVAALERKIRIRTHRNQRIILAWRDTDGRLTKVADSHPELPDDTVYQEDMVARWFKTADATPARTSTAI
jgi:hypothetical protein